MKFFLRAVFLLLSLVPLSAQDDFGFGFGGEGAEDISGGLGGGLGVSIGGEVKASIAGYVDDFSTGADAVRLGDIFSGRLNFSAETSRAKGVVNLKLAPTPVYYDAKSPVYVDEAYAAFYFGGFDIEGGLRKLTWGKADSMGPLDVINPLDYSDFSMMTDALRDPMILKIARPLLHASFRIGSFSKIEGVFVPNFEPARFDESGRWTPAQLRQLSKPPVPGIKVQVNRPGTATLDYAQAGARFTTTIGPADLGAQYYYGRLTKPAATAAIMFTQDPPVNVEFIYNPYHHIGVDYAQVLFGFNIRAEFAANITGDFAGDDGAVYNPALVWSLGFDRDLLWGVNLNAQINESITLFHDKIADGLYTIKGGGAIAIEIEAGSDITATQLIASLSKKFFRDELEARLSVLWEAEAGDFLLMPSLVWTKDAVSVELSGGIFGGNEEGQFGQYRDNGFVKAGLSYTF